MKKSYKFSLLNFATFMLLSGALLLWFISPGFAQEGEGTDAEPVENNICLQEIMPEAMVYYADVTTFISEHYLSQEPATELLDVALQKFNEFKKNMLALINTFYAEQEGAVISPDPENEEYAQCKLFIETQIRTVEQMLRNHHLANSSAKVTYTLVTKMKAINEGLRDLNENFARVYALFTTLSNTLTSASK
ncbi:MAG: hypothetical protein WC882_00170 [Candidatus Gracilibacteria bacterium]|jgi:hypothetical protein